MSKRTGATNSQLIAKAQTIREREHRLKPGLRLKTPLETVMFVHDKGLVSTLGSNELPSLIRAILGSPWKPRSKGFTGWLDWWSIEIGGQRISRFAAELERRDDILASRVFRRSKTLVSSRLWPILNPIIEHHKNLLTGGNILTTTEIKLRKTIESEDAVRTDHLRKRAKMEGKDNNYRFHRALNNLESYGLIVGAEDPQPERHMHANIWQTWEKRTSGKTTPVQMTYETAFLKLLEATIQAAVLVREDEIQGWYRWDADLEKAKEKLLDAGTVVRVNHYLIHSKALSI